MADFLELQRQLGERRGYDGNPTRLGSWINQAIREIYGKRQDWSWARAEVQFSLRPNEIGTVDATFTADSNLVSGLDAATVSRTGAWLTLPDGPIGQIVAGASAGTSVYLSTKIPSSSTTAYKVYFLDYPFPAGMRGIQSITVTGDGNTYPLEGRSINPQSMSLLTARDYETTPTLYSVIKHSRLPTPRSVAGLAAAGSGSGLTAGVYTYWWCLRNTATDELGPLSPLATVTTTSGQEVTVTAGTKHDLGRRLFRSLVGGSAPYFLADIASTGTYVDDRSDDDLGTDETTFIEHGRHTDAGGQHLIRFWPPPDKAYVVTAQIYRPYRDLVEDNDVPWIPEEHQGAILELATAFAFGDDESVGAVAQARRTYGELLNQMEQAEDVDEGTDGALGGGLGRRLRRENFGWGEGRFPHIVGQ